MKTYLTQAVFFFLGVFLLTQNLFAQQISLDDFNKLSIKDNIQVVITQSGNQIYYAEPSNDAVYVQNEKGTLNIKRKLRSGNITLYLEAKTINAIELFGASEVSSTGTINSADLTLKLTGSGDITLEVKTVVLQADLAGSGDIKLSGNTQKFTASIVGSGDLNAPQLLADEVKITVSGSGDATVNAIKVLDANVAGSGDIRYIGKPESRNVNIAGSGSITETSAHVNDKSEINFSFNSDSLPGNKIDTTRLSIGNKKVIIIDDKDKADNKKAKEKKEMNPIWKGVEFGFNQFGNKPFNTTLPYTGAYNLDFLRSNVVNINFWEKNFCLYKNNIALTTGAGFQFNRYMMDNNYNFLVYHDSIVPILSANSYTKNMIKSTYLTVPLLLHFASNSNHKRTFHFAIGAQAGLKLGSRSKQVFYKDGNKRKDIFLSDYNLNPFQYGLTARVGYGPIDFFANYSLSGLFKANKGAEMYLLQIGVTLIHF